MGGKIFIVIPAYNEQSTIKGVLRSLQQNKYNNIIVVDDCSSDKTSLISKENGAMVVRHEVNRGQGAALQTGIDYALSQGADIIVMFDADGQHQAEEIKDIVKPVQQGEVEVTLGSRFLGKKSNAPFFKKIVLKGGIIFTYLTSGILLSDTHNGFRALSREAAQKIHISQDRMEHASEIIEEIHKKHIKYKEVPVTITYTDYSKKKGQSPIESLRIAFKVIFKKLVS